MHPDNDLLIECGAAPEPILDVDQHVNPRRALAMWLAVMTGFFGIYQVAGSFPRKDPTVKIFFLLFFFFEETFLYQAGVNRLLANVPLPSDEERAAGVVSKYEADGWSIRGLVYVRSHRIVCFFFFDFCLSPQEGYTEKNQFVDREMVPAKKYVF